MSLLTYDKYMEQALQTIKPHTTKEMALADWALGLGGESGEVLELIMKNSTDKMEFAKELGDILWYSVALASELSLSFPSSTFDDIHMFTNSTHCAKCISEDSSIVVAMNKLSLSICAIQEQMKHAIMHKEKFEKDTIADKLTDVWLGIAKIAGYYEFTIFEVAGLNVAKLAHRYDTANGGQYNIEASANRHEAELQFEDTDVYKNLYELIVGVPCGE